MPRKKKPVQAEQPQNGNPAPQLNKSEIVREALQKLGLEAGSKDVDGYIRKTHGDQVADAMKNILQNYVSQQKKKLRGETGAAPKAAKRGRPKSKGQPPAQLAPAKSPVTGSGGFADDMTSLAVLVKKYGPDELRRLTELLGKR